MFVVVGRAHFGFTRTFVFLRSFVRARLCVSFLVLCENFFFVFVLCEIFSSFLHFVKICSLCFAAGHRESHEYFKATRCGRMTRRTDLLIDIREAAAAKTRRMRSAELAKKR